MTENKKQMTDFLENLSVAEYRKLTLNDYVELTKNDFLQQDSREMLERLKEYDFPADFYSDLIILAFVYRNIKTAFCKKVRFLLNGTASESNCPGNAGVLGKMLAKQKSLSFYKQMALAEEAGFLKKKMEDFMLKSGGSVCCCSHYKPNKREALYRKISQGALTKPLIRVIRKEIGDNSESLDAVRRGYFRWKQKEANHTLSLTEGLLQFMALLSVVYRLDKEDYDSRQLFYHLQEGPSFEVSHVRACFSRLARRTEAENFRETSFMKAMKQYEGEKREQGRKMLESLARKNYLPAIRILTKDMVYPPLTQSRYFLRAAILGDRKSADSCGWGRALGLDHLPLEICGNNTALRTRYYLVFPLTGAVEKHSLLKNISFHVDVNHEDWEMLRSKLKGYRVLPCDVLQIIPAGKAKLYKKIEVDASPANFDQIMKHAGLLSRHIDVILQEKGSSRKLEITTTVLQKEPSSGAL